MIEFLAEFYDRTQADDVGALLGSVCLLEDGVTADSAMWGEWLASIESAKSSGGKLQLE
jgi:hypothetical protein